MNNDAIKILLVEDHQLVRQGLRRLLEQEAGITVVGEAANLQSALDLIRQHAPGVVIMDVYLSDQSGIEAGRRILQEFPGIKLIALTSDANPQTATQALRAGFAGYVIKENQVDELIRALRLVVAGKLALCPIIAAGMTQSLLAVLADDELLGKPELTERERKLLVLVAEGKRNKEIADELQVNPKSVETYRFRLMKKLGCASMAALVRYAVREGLVKG